MKVTVCELRDNEVEFVEDWTKLKTHVHDHKPDLLLLPEMPFCKWVASQRQPNYAARVQGVEKHERWLKELEKLKATYIVYTRPVIDDEKFYNTAFVYEQGVGHRKIHTKSLFPEEPHFWEETWYDADPNKLFEPVTIGDTKIGVLICTEMWFTQHARNYGKHGVDILLCPRASGMASVNQWIRCGQTLSVISGAYCLSSNRAGNGDNDFQWGGGGWITKPCTGNLVGVTSSTDKFLTREIDISKSRAAKLDYPLYVKD